MAGLEELKAGRAEAYPLRRRDVVARLLQDRGDLLVVAGLGACAWDITAAGDHPLNFPLWGAMGGAVPIGLGLALAQPDRRVLVITGDGEMLMGLGALATVAAQAVENLAIAVIDNERYGETGSQLTHTAGPTDLSAAAAACGLPHCLNVGSDNELAAALPVLREQAGPVFCTIKVRAENLPFDMPPKDGASLRDRFRVALLGAERALQ